MNISPEVFHELKSRSLFKGKIISDSMEPVIRTGEDITVKVGEKDLKRFDIIVIYQDDKLVCHYLWQMNRIVRPVLLQTRNMKGTYDHPVSEDHYLGKVISHQIGFLRKLSLLF